MPTFVSHRQGRKPGTAPCGTVLSMRYVENALLQSGPPAKVGGGMGNAGGGRDGECGRRQGWEVSGGGCRCRRRSRAGAGNAESESGARESGAETGTRGKPGVEAGKAGPGARGSRGVRKAGAGSGDGESGSGSGTRRKPGQEVRMSAAKPGRERGQERGFGKRSRERAGGCAKPPMTENAVECAVCAADLRPSGAAAPHNAWSQNSRT